MGYLSQRNSTTNKNGSLHIIVVDATAQSGYRSYKILVDDILAAAQLRSEKDQPNGYVGTDVNNKINPIHLPAIAITNTYVVSSQSEMLALSVTVGSVAVRTDESKSYILQTEPSSVLENWIELEGVSGVASFNGRTGTVTPQNGDYTADQITETATRVFLTPAQLAHLVSLTGVDVNAFHTNATGEINGLTDIGTIADASVFLAEKTGVFEKVKVTFIALYNWIKSKTDLAYAAINHNHDEDYEPIRTDDQNYVTDTEKVNIGNLAGTNTGDQYADQDTILGNGTDVDPWYVNPDYTGDLPPGLWNDRGAYNASSNLYPSTNGSGLAGLIKRADTWTITVGGTLGTTDVIANQTVRALVDNPGQTSSNWTISAGGSSGGTAESITFEPVGSISSTDVQAMGEELDLESRFEVIEVACSDLSTANAAATNVASFHMPFSGTLVEVISSLDTVATGSTHITDINYDGATCLSTKLSIDASEYDSSTAATPAVISVSAFAKDKKVSIDRDQVGATIAGKGHVVSLKFLRD